MRIAFTIVNVSNCGGTERVLLSIASELSRLGHDIHIISLFGKGEPYFEYDRNVKIHVLLSSFEKKYLSTHTKYLIWKIRLFFQKINPDVVVDTELLSANLSIPALKGSIIKHVVWDNFSYEYFKNVYPEQIALEKLKSNGSYLITLTKKDRDLYIHDQKFNPDRIFQIYNPTMFDLDKSINHSSHKVISVGRFAKEKGFDLLLKAWKIVESTNNEWSLDIFGDTGIDTGNVHETFLRLELKRAYLHGTTKEIEQEYKDASIYVLPSRHEGLGLVLLEASANSLPLIAYDCPNGPREIIRDGENGILVEPENVDALATAILRLIGNKRLRDQMGKNAYERSKDFQMAKIIPQWISLFEKIQNS